MLRKVFTLVSAIAFVFTFSAEAKIWRVNNTPAINADFTTFNAAVTSTSVIAGDTLYMEPSATSYATSSFVMAKRLVVIGPGYFLDPTDATFPFNPGLQVATKEAHFSFFRMGPGSDGSKFLGVSLDGTVYMNGASNVQFEKCFFGYGSLYFENGTNDNVTVRKCYFHGAASIYSTTGVTNPVRVITNLIVENNLFVGGYVSLDQASGSGNVFRNNSFYNSGSTQYFSNIYVANNIFGTGGQCNFVNCTVKNNLFQTNQTLPPTATNNQVSVNMANVYIGGSTGSHDSRVVLKAGSPAIGAGLTIGAVISPDCGAFGATDPYKLSGIPNIPSIYSLTVPISIPSGSTTMNVTFSTRNNQ